MFSFPRLMRSAIALVFAAGFLLAAPWPHESEAANVISLIGNGFNFGSDEDREYLIDRVGAVPGQIDVGDSLRGSFNINTLNFSGANLGGATPNNEWTGVFQFLVVAKQDLGGGFFLFTLGPDPAFATSLCGGVASCIATQPQMDAIVPGVGAMVVMFEDTNHNFAGDFDDVAAGALAGLSDDGTPHVAPHPGSGPGHTPPSSADVSTGNKATEEAFIARAADGLRFWTIGFTNGVPDGPGSVVAGPGEGFTALAINGDNILAAFTITAGSSFSLNNGGLNRIGNAVPEIGDAVPLGQVVSAFAAAGGNVLCNPAAAVPCGTAQFAFTGSTRGVFDLDTAFEASSNVDASFFVPTPPGTNDSQIPGSVLVFPKFITGTVNVGTATQPVAAPKTSFEISVTCPADLPRCAVGTRVKLMAHWVCPGSQDSFNKFICQEVDFTLDTTVKGTVWFSPEPGNTFALAPVPGTGTNPTPNVPAPPCPLGYLIVWAVSPDDIDNPRAISFNGLIGNAVIREANASAGAYNAIPIQSVRPTCVAGTGGDGQPACVPTILDPTDPDRTLKFDGSTEYALVPGKVVATVRLDRDFVAGDGRTTPNQFRIDSYLTLLTLDVNSNRSNLPVFVDLDFFNEVENVRSTFTEFVCWMEKSLSRPDPTRQAATSPPCGPGSCINANLREHRFPGKKVLLESGQAVKQQFIGVSDPDCPPNAQFVGLPTGTCPVTLLGIIETKERGNGGANAPYVREYSYNLFNNGFGVVTNFRPN